MTATIVATLDGAVSAADQPLIHSDDLGLLRGDGVFETTLAVDGHPRDLGEHLARLGRSAGMLDFTVPSEAAWRTGVDSVLAAWTEPGEMVLRLVATRGREHGGGPTCLVLGGTLPEQIRHERERGLSVLLLDRGFTGSQVAQLPWLLAGAKSLSYAINMAARRYALAQGADDAIFVGQDGQLLEGPTSTLVVARGRTLYTPPVDGILGGVTVKRLFRSANAAGWQTRVSPLTPADLHNCEGVWLVSGVRLIAAVLAVDGVRIPRGSAHSELVDLLRVPVPAVQH